MVECKRHGDISGYRGYECVCKVLRCPGYQEASWVGKQAGWTTVRAE